MQSTRSTRSSVPTYYLSMWVSVISITNAINDQSTTLCPLIHPRVPGRPIDEEPLTIPAIPTTKTMQLYHQMMAKAMVNKSPRVSPPWLRGAKFAMRHHPSQYHQHQELILVLVSKIHIEYHFNVNQMLTTISKSTCPLLARAQSFSRPTLLRFLVSITFPSSRRLQMRCVLESCLK